MADAFWNRQPPMHLQPGMLKRPRSEYDHPPEFHNYLAHDNARGGIRSVNELNPIGAPYDRYLPHGQRPLISGEVNNYGGVGLGRGLGGLGGSVGHGGPGFSIGESGLMGRNVPFGSELAAKGRGGLGFGSQLSVDSVSRPGREIAPVPHGASSTLYVEGLPSNITKREVSHIFRPFVGYREVRLVSKESRNRGGDPLILCFVDFINPECAGTALGALQGYKIDENEADSPFLRLQFSRSPGPKSGGTGQRGKR